MRFRRRLAYAVCAAVAVASWTCGEARNDEVMVTVETATPTPTATATATTTNTATPEPTATPIAPTPLPLRAAVVGEVVAGYATHYGVGYETGESCGHAGTPCNLGCTGLPYRSRDTSIIAVGYSNSGRWPCGTSLLVCGAGGCIATVRSDTCPGCDGAGYVADLSEAGIDAVCGAVNSSRCAVTIQLAGDVGTGE